MKQDKSYYSEKKKKWSDDRSQIGSVPQTGREMCSDMVGIPSDDKDFKCCIKLVKPCIEKEEKGLFAGESSSKKHRLPGTGRKVKVESVRSELFQYFIDVRYSLKARLPIRVFLSKAKELYAGYCDTMEEKGEVPEEIVFSRQWLKGWCQQYRISLKHMHAVTRKVYHSYNWIIASDR